MAQPALLTVFYLNNSGSFDLGTSLSERGLFLGIQFYLLLSPYLCFISLLYLDLYVLGDNALIS